MASCLPRAPRPPADCFRPASKSSRPASLTLATPRLALPARAVSAGFLPQLLSQKMYACPQCQSRQSISLSAQQERDLRVQAQALIAQGAQQALALQHQLAARMAQQQQLARAAQGAVRRGAARGGGLGGFGAGRPRG